MTRAILVCWHKYTPYGDDFYEPLLDYFLMQMRNYSDEYDMIYFIDSTWNIDPARLNNLKAKIIKVNPSLRYYDAYKEVLPQVEEDLVLLLDDDMVIYRAGVISSAFLLLEGRTSTEEEVGILDKDVVSITDTIGTMEVPLKTGNKLCPYFFATRKELLMKYSDIDWGPQMPYTETLGLLTEAMCKDGLKIYEMEDDKSNILFDGTKDGDSGKDFGYYHVRAGSTIAYLLAEKTYGNPDTYHEYIKNQPHSEIIRHMAWYDWMCGQTIGLDWFILRPIGIPFVLLIKDVNIGEGDPSRGSRAWMDYQKRFDEYHKLPERRMFSFKKPLES